MKKLSVFIVLLFLFTNSLRAQTTLSFDLSNAKHKTFYLLHTKTTFESEFPNDGYESVYLKKYKDSVKTLHIDAPTFYTLYYKEDGKNREIRYDLYLSPGDQIAIKADLNQPDQILVTGKGSQNNQPLLSLRNEPFDLSSFYGDTTLIPALAAIKKQEALLRNKFSDYVKQYHPTKSFISDWELNMQYFTASNFYDFSLKNQYEIKESYPKYQRDWHTLQNQVFQMSSLNNDQAVNSPNYINLLQNLLTNETTFLITTSLKDTAERTSFFKEWYQTDSEDGMDQLFTKRGVKLFTEKILQRYFTGKSAAYLYVVLLEHAIRLPDGDKNVVDIFNRFKQQFPENEYLKWFQPGIDKIILNAGNKLSQKMFFLPENGSNLDTFEEVLTISKGKTVLLDMWGTWCSPCRANMEQYGPALKAHFTNKGLDYLYVANNDTKNEMEWKKLIAYYGLEGAHILANEKLSRDIMQKVKGTGYPTYVLIRKDGTFEKLDAGFPMNEEVLFKQLAAALSM